jgi:hypothetical protein
MGIGALPPALNSVFLPQKLALDFYRILCKWSPELALVPNQGLDSIFIPGAVPQVRSNSSENKKLLLGVHGNTKSTVTPMLDISLVFRCPSEVKLGG